MRIAILFITTCLFVSVPSGIEAQIADDFSDGDFTQNPVWTGDAANFIVNAAGELQLNAPDAGVSTLFVQGNIPDSAIWDLRFRLEFAPSATNLLRIFLLADQPDPALANGYLLEAGENGSLDALKLFRQDAGARTLLATGQPGLVAGDPTDIHLRMKRTVAGEWQLEAASGNGVLQLQFTVPDATYGGGSDRYFGFQCVYTATRKDKFYFDDISIQPDVPDLQAPLLLSAEALNANTVQATFNESLDSLSAIDPAHYQIDNGIGMPVSVLLLPDRRTVNLNLLSPLSSGNYQLQTLAVQDMVGNESGVQTIDFQFVNITTAEEFDILINEIMADPTPSVGLPDAEWVELYNRSGKTLDLAGLRFQDATGSPVALPSQLLSPDTYVVLTATANAAALQAATGAPVLGIAISATALNNGGDVLTLSDASGNVIDRVAYDVAWHTDPDKDDGGWSLERIAPGIPCLGASNWRSCNTLPGGTPGAQNSVFDDVADTEAPQLIAAYPESPVSLLLYFSEGLDKALAQDPSVFRIDPPVNIATAQTTADDRSIVRLALSNPLQASVLYAVSAVPPLSDCAGNPVSAQDTTFVGIPEKPEPQDIVVNEMMFNPDVGDARYVEFYNRSNKIFRWSEFFIANFSGGADVETITATRLFLPGQYDVFTTNPANIQGDFANIHPNNVLENTFPSFADDAGNVTLYWTDGNATVIVDSFDYSADLHNALYTSGAREGVALERIDAGAPTNLASNWTSASPAVTGAPGTPTLPNSQRRQMPVAGTDDLIFLPVGRFSPDDDGYEDFLDIRYAVPEAGYAAAITIFSADGVPVKRLVRQELIGTEGSLRWDGDQDDGTRAGPGIYILFAELYNGNGAVRNIKKSFALVNRF
ncbi:MAG: lamin tail domain-containing protein [Saprospiraceae bacterium]